MRKPKNLCSSCKHLVKFTEVWPARTHLHEKKYLEPEKMEGCAIMNRTYVSESRPAITECSAYQNKS